VVVSSTKDPIFVSVRNILPPGRAFLSWLPPLLRGRAADALIIGDPDHESKELAAAIIRLQEPQGTTANMTLQKLRNDLAVTLARYKLLALLRVLRDDEEIPRTVAGKPIKRGLLQKFFQIQDFIPANYAVDGSSTGVISPSRSCLKSDPGTGADYNETTETPNA
jgi:hypothetical protein